MSTIYTNIITHMLICNHVVRKARAPKRRRKTIECDLNFGCSYVFVCVWLYLQVYEKQSKRRLEEIYNTLTLHLSLWFPDHIWVAESY